MTDYTEDVLRRLQDLLVLIPAETGPQTALLTHDDQLFIFETAGLLITSGNFDAEVNLAYRSNDPSRSPIISISIFFLL